MRDPMTPPQKTLIQAESEAYVKGQFPLAKPSGGQWEECVQDFEAGLRRGIELAEKCAHRNEREGMGAEQAIGYLLACEDIIADISALLDAPAGGAG